MSRLSILLPQSTVNMIDADTQQGQAQIVRQCQCHWIGTLSVSGTPQNNPTPFHLALCAQLLLWEKKEELADRITGARSRSSASWMSPAPWR